MVKRVEQVWFHISESKCNFLCKEKIYHNLRITLRTEFCNVRILRHGRLYLQKFSDEWKCNYLLFWNQIKYDLAKCSNKMELDIFSHGKSWFLLFFLCFGKFVVLGQLGSPAWPVM